MAKSSRRSGLAEHADKGHDPPPDSSEAKALLQDMHEVRSSKRSDGREVQKMQKPGPQMEAERA